MAKDNLKELKSIFASEKSFDADSIVQVPQGKNSVPNIKDLFFHRQYYSGIIIPYVSYINNNNVPFGDLLSIDAFYGLNDNNKDAILPDDSYLKEIPTANDGTAQVMNFVADAFNDMNSYLATAAMLGKISRNSPFFNLKAHKSYVDPNFYIKNAQSVLGSQFDRYVNSNQSVNSSIKNSYDFNKKFIQFLKKQINNNFPITKTSLVYSTNFSSFVSGLIIDIAKDKADDDSVKYNKYFNDPNFSTFADACKRFGFMIDVNVPWRIMADINSSAMNKNNPGHIGYMLRYNINNSNELYNQKYNLVFNTELDYLKDMFWKIYYVIAYNNPYYMPDYKQLQPCDINYSVYHRREMVEREKYYKTFNDSYWLRLYAYLRNYETSTGLSQQQFENIVREADNYLKAGRYFSALKYINDYFKKNDKQNVILSLQQNIEVVKEIASSKSSPDLIF